MLGFFVSFLYVVEVVTCLLLAGAVLLQKPKEGGLGGVVGGAGGDVFGADAGNVLVKATAFLGTVFLATTFLLACLVPKVSGSSVMESAAPAEETSAGGAEAPVNAPGAGGSQPAG